MIQQLIDFLENERSFKFDMGAWREQLSFDEPVSMCNTSACLAGSLVLMYLDGDAAELMEWPSQRIVEKAVELLDLPHFYYESGTATGDDALPIFHTKDWPRYYRRLAEGFEVDENGLPVEEYDPHTDLWITGLGERGAAIQLLKDMRDGCLVITEIDDFVPRGEWWRKVAG